MDSRKEFEIFLEQQLEKKAMRPFFHSGSVEELPIAYFLSKVTDLDYMHITYQLCAIPDDAIVPEKFRGTFFRFDSSNIHPGFVRLRCDSASRVYLDRRNIPETEDCNGPATTLYFARFQEVIKFPTDQELDLMHKMDDKGLTLDFVTAIPCPVWPDEANEWIARKRKHWPTQDLIEKVVRRGCHFVCKSHRKTPKDTSMFRISFSSAEILLVKNWSDHQKYIYHILRKVKNEMTKQCLNRNCESVICSYTMKTLMLWSCEKKSPDFWTNRPNDDLVRELLLVLSRWLTKRKCPNYFIRNNNMFDHFSDKDIDLTLELLNAFVTEEKTLLAIFADEKFINGPNLFSLVVSSNVLLTCQLYLNQFHFITDVSTSKKFCTANGLVSGGYEFENLFQAISAQREIMQFEDINSSRSCQTRNRFIENKFLLATSDFQGNASVIKFDLSLSMFENAEPVQKQIEFLQRRGDRSCLYLRDKHRETFCDCDSNENISDNWKLSYRTAADFLIRAIEFVYPKATYFVIAAYRCNYYFSYLHDYQACLSVCDETIAFYDKSNNIAFAGYHCDMLCSVILSSKWSAIFDKYLKASFGFLLLHNYLAKYETAESCSNLTVLLSPISFVTYIKSQSLLSLGHLLTRSQKKGEYFRLCVKLLLQHLEFENLLQIAVHNKKFLEDYCQKAASEKLSRLSVYQSQRPDHFILIPEN